MNWRSASDAEVLTEIGLRLKQMRLNLNQTQAKLAEQAGVSLLVVIRAEGGQGCTLASLARLMRALGALGQLDALLPNPGASPLALARMKGHDRQRARRTTKKVVHG